VNHFVARHLELELCHVITDEKFGVKNCIFADGDSWYRKGFIRPDTCCGTDVDYRGITTFEIELNGSVVRTRLNNSSVESRQLKVLRRHTSSKGFKWDESPYC